MPYQIDWLIPNRIIDVTLKDETNIEELMRLVQVMEAYIRDGEAPIHIIMRADTITSFPNDIQDSYKIFRLLPRQQIGYLIVTTTDTVLQYITSTTARLIGLRWRTYATSEEAIQFLARIDKSLDWETQQSAH